MRVKLALLSLLLSSCSIILPKQHDPVMLDRIVDVHTNYEQTTCDNKDWDKLLSSVHHLKIYASLRSDPQSNNIDQMEQSLRKANETKSQAFCESILKLNKTRIDIVEEAWRGR